MNCFENFEMEYHLLKIGCNEYSFIKYWECQCNLKSTCLDKNRKKDMCTESLRLTSQERTSGTFHVGVVSWIQR